MIEIRYEGWFQCRLATDPDPSDEPRGVSGWTYAYVDEPDLDRVISLQRPAFVRDHAPDVGVRVSGVTVDGQEMTHPLVGAAVNLLGQPKFHGFNHIVAEDGTEPVLPFEIEVSADRFVLSRSAVPEDPEYPYAGFLAAGAEINADGMRSVTHVPDLSAVWRSRAALLEDELKTAAEPHATALRERLAFIQTRADTQRFFTMKVTYQYELAGSVRYEDPDHLLPAGQVDGSPWTADFWFGAYDADSLCGYTQGTITIGAAPAATLRGTPFSALQRRPDLKPTD